MRHKLAQVIKHPHFKTIVPFAWFGFTFFGIISTITLLVLTMSGANYMDSIKYTIYAAKPLVLGTSSTRIEYSDSRAMAIDKVMEKYKCPMTGLGKTFVEEADKNNIPYWIVASIAFQESSCGKNTPVKAGAETFNAYGYGVWGDNVKGFDDWEHGIEVMSTYMDSMFYSKGTTELCEIMKVYTPPSKGSWCEGVAFFRDEIIEYETPDF